MRLATPERETLTLADGTAVVRWRRSTRARRISLRIDPALGEVVITLPTRAGRRAGMMVLHTHADWVARRLRALPEALRFADGARVPVGGKLMTIRHVPDGRFAARLRDDTLEVCGAAEFLPRRVADFLRAEARRMLASRVQEVSQRAGVAAARVSIKDTRSRWGSCSPTRALAFSWRLVMAPDFVADYVVSHEVAHLRHMNHGPGFWSLVDQLTPNRTRAETWLAEQGAGLLRVG